MPYPFSFSVRHAYKPTDLGVSVPVSISAGTETVKLFAKVDTGADYCVFSRGYAEALLIDVDTGIAQRFSTAAGEFRAFGHEVRLEVLGIGVGVIVYFYENPESTRNVLGRNGWLNQVRFGLVDYDSLVYFSHYDE